MSNALKTIRSNLSDKDINKMDFKELRNEVQNLRDTVSMALRTYEDMLYNLDNDNFSTSIIEEKKDMKKSIELSLTAEEFSIKAAAIEGNMDEMRSEFTVTAKAISASVSSVQGDLDSTKVGLSSLIQQTADDVNLSVTAINADIGTLRAEIKTTSEEIESKVSRTDLEGVLTEYSTISQTEDKITAAVADVDDKIYQLSVTAEGITSKVSNIIDGEESIFQQLDDEFLLDGDRTTITGVISFADRRYDGKGIVSMFYDETPERQYFMIHGNRDDGTATPIILGNQDVADRTSNVYIGNNAPEGMIVTRGWLDANPIVAVFG